MAAKVPAAPDPARQAGSGQFWTLFVDGGARGNPGPSGAGAVLYNERNRRVAAMKWALGHHTNNEAEYEALIRGMEMSAAAGARSLEVRSDSELMVKQMIGQYRVRAAHLVKYARRACEVVADFAEVRFKAVPREQNREADRLANQAMDEVEKRAGKPRQEAQ